MEAMEIGTIQNRIYTVGEIKLLWIKQYNGFEFYSDKTISISNTKFVNEPLHKAPFNYYKNFDKCVEIFDKSLLICFSIFLDFSAYNIKNENETWFYYEGIINKFIVFQNEDDLVAYKLIFE